MTTMEIWVDKETGVNYVSRKRICGRNDAAGSRRKAGRFAIDKWIKELPQ